MKRLLLLAALLLIACSAPTMALSPSENTSSSAISDSRALVPGPDTAVLSELSEPSSPRMNEKDLAALWPNRKNAGGKDTSALTPKSPRKAFFLSLLLPGLGEYYAGSNRGVFFLAVEAAGWWTYAHYTGKGDNLEEEYETYADTNWKYNSSDRDYIGWFENQLTESGIEYTADLIDEYADLAQSAHMDSLTEALINEQSTTVTHSLPSTKTQQYYEMIGKYPQFVFGWEDVDSLNAIALSDSGYNASIRGIKSNMRDHYETLRHDSNTNLKLGMNGVNLLILNRIVSAIDAARVAYYHNKGLDSELSMVRVNFVQKKIIDHRVPMLVVSKPF